MAWRGTRAPAVATGALRRAALQISGEVALKMMLLFPSAPLLLAHASMIMPPSRNAIDAELTSWSNGKHPDTGFIEPYSCSCVNGTEAECNSGQGCFWFSQGCSIGCPHCDGNGARIPNMDHCPSVEKPKQTLHPRYWTMNQRVTPGSHQDIFKYEAH